MMIQKLLIAVGWVALINIPTMTAAHAFDEGRMSPAQRMYVDGAQTSHRDQARSRVRGAAALTSRGRPFDEVRSAADPVRVRAVRRTSKARRGAKRVVGSTARGIVLRK